MAVAQGYEGEMTYMAKQPERRFDPEKLLPGAKSVIALAMPYYVSDGAGAKVQQCTDAPKRRSARYARGRDYHKVIGQAVGRVFALYRSPGAGNAM